MTKEPTTKKVSKKEKLDGKTVRWKWWTLVPFPCGKTGRYGPLVKWGWGELTGTVLYDQGSTLWVQPESGNYKRSIKREDLTAVKK